MDFVLPSKQQLDKLSQLVGSGAIAKILKHIDELEENSDLSEFCQQIRGLTQQFRIQDLKKLLHDLQGRVDK